MTLRFATTVLVHLVCIGAHAAQTANQATSKREARFLLDADSKVYRVGINFAYQTTIWTPVACRPPSVGDPEYFHVLAPDTEMNRFVLVAAVERPGAVTNITFQCADGIRFVLEAQQVEAGSAVFSVEFAINAKDDVRVSAIREEERLRCKDQTDERILALQTTLEAEAQNQLVLGMLRRLTMSDDTEAARENFVIVKTTQQLLVGDKGYIVFSVQNRTSKPIVIKSIEVLTGDEPAMPLNSTLVMPEPRVASDATKYAVALFDAPEDFSAFTLVVREDGPRVIRLSGIDF